MLGRFYVVLVLLLCSARVATADDPPPQAPTAPDPSLPPEPSPPPVPVVAPVPLAGPTIVAGRVTDVLGRPVPNARIYVLPRRGTPHQTSTNKDGRYATEVHTIGTHGVVIAIGKAHTFRTVLVRAGATSSLDVELELDSDGGEVIKIEDRKRPLPKVAPKPKQDVRKSLPYSDESIERDAWALSWMLLDVDERGTVTRLKLLKNPGFDLERICIEQAFKLTFTPALDDAGRPMKTYVLWKFEWPSWGWLLEGNGTTLRRPRDSNELHSLTGNFHIAGREHERDMDGLMDSDNTVPVGGPWAEPLATANAFDGALDRVPCAGSGPLNLDLRNRAYRDCSQPDMTLAESLPWITRETAETALAELTNPNLVLVTDEPHGSRVPGWIGVGVTGALAVATIFAFAKFDRISDGLDDNPIAATVDREQYNRDAASGYRWGKITLGLTAVTLAAAGTTFLIWNRNASKRSFSVQPSSPSGGSGAAAWFTMDF